MPEIQITKATPTDATPVAVMVGKLLEEIMDAIGHQAFSFNLAETEQRLRKFIQDGRYVVFLASNSVGEAGFIALTESYALYAEGTFGTIPELYVRPDYRSEGVGKALLDTARKFAHNRGWTRLEVTTPPLPYFDRSLLFYEQQGFAITGGRKMKLML